MRRLMACCSATLLAVVLLALSSASVVAEDEDGGQTRQEIAESLSAIENLLDTQASKQRAIETLRQRLERTDSESEREIIETELRDLSEEMRQLDAQIQGVATGVNDGIFDTGDRSFDLQAELEELIQPFVLMLKSATENARQIEQLRQTLSDAERREEVAAEALVNLAPALEAATPDTATALRLAELETLWTERREAAGDLAKAAQRQMDARLAQQIDPAEAAQAAQNAANDAVQSFFSATGRNLILGVGAFAGVLFLLRLLKRGFFSVIGARRARSFPGRLGGLIFDIFTICAAFGAMLVIFNFYNDWLLTGLTILVLIAIGWMVLSSLPNLIEQISLLLNLGAVQEGERVMFNGAPWLVKRLDLYTDLENPALRGGTFTLPVRALAGLYSRPMGENEVWFPSEEGDWVILENEVFGKVVFQSPEIVQVEEEGGAIVTFNLAAYLEQNPRNLSHGFRVTTSFGLDHSHQAIAGEEIPRTMRDYIKGRLATLVDPAQIRAVDAALVSASPSSLDFDLEIDLTGEAAPLYEDLKDALSRFALQCCAQNGWKLPAQPFSLRRAS
ncbi:MAG: hypothetical protein AAF661_04000 [Pseudomonadota bacterium]